MTKSNPIRFNANFKNIRRHTLIELYKMMLRIRMVQRRIEKEYPKDEIKTPVHLCTGQEAISAGVCANLKKEDYVFSNYRGHGHYLAKGGDLKRLIAELYGKEAGCSKGRGGSMHIIDTSVGLMGTTSIVGGGIPIATGAALSAVLQKNNRIAVVFFGDGAMDEGVLYESINFAMLKKLPVIYACENNFYAVCSPQKNRQYLDNIYRRFEGCGIPGYRIDGNNVIDVYLAAKKAIEACRNKKGPSFIEFRTYRWHGHSGGGSDVSLGYRTQKELDQWVKRCPVENFERFLLKKTFITKENIESIMKVFDEEINEAFDFAKNSREPNTEDLLKYAYSEEE